MGSKSMELQVEAGDQVPCAASHWVGAQLAAGQTTLLCFDVAMTVLRHCTG